jgi:uncharacterized membrane protein YbhN (UPF0104 family)
MDREKPRKNILLPMVRWLIVLAVLALLFRQVSWQDIGEAMGRVPLWSFLLALLLLHGSQWLSVVRFRVYLPKAAHSVGWRELAALYYRGMALNLLLPGGVGGDGYKAWVIHRSHSLPLLAAVRVMLAERGSGLLIVLMMVVSALAYPPFLMPILAHFDAVWAKELPAWFWVAMAFALTGALLLAYILWIGRLTGETIQQSRQALVLSVGVQLLSVASFGVLLWGGGLTPQQSVVWLFWFQIAAIAGLLPITIAGVGLREWLYWLISPWYGADPAHMVAFSLLWFLAYIIVACSGLAYAAYVRGRKPMGAK